MTPSEAAELLRVARRIGVSRAPFSDADPSLDEEWAYATQDADREARVRAGEVVVGAKLGLTSPAKQQRMGVDRPVLGFLTDRMLVDAGEVSTRLGEWIQPRIEPEIAFVTARAIERPVPRADVPAYVASVLLAAEVIDSRYTGYRFRLPDVVADDTSAAAVVLGPRRHRLCEVGELADLTCEVRVDGSVTHTARGAAILGDPLEALVRLADHVARRGERLPAGSLVLAGALTDAEPLVAGRSYELSVSGLGALRVPL